MKDDLIELSQILRGFAYNQIIATAVRLDIPQILLEKDRSAAEISSIINLDIEKTKIILSALNGLGIIKYNGDSVYSKTSMTELLGRKTGKMYGQALLCGDMYYHVWSELDYSLRTGSSSFEKIYSTNMWDYFNIHPELGDLFARTMGAGSRLVSNDLLNAIDFSSVATVVDVGAGDGSLIATALSRNPGLKGVAIDLPNQLSNIRSTLEYFGVADRCRVLGQDFFSDIPSYGDIYIFKGVFHNWPNEKLSSLVDYLFKNLRPGAQILVVERCIPPNDTMTLNQAVNTLTMLLLFGTLDRSAIEYEKLFKNAGFISSIRHLKEIGIDVISGLKP